jgi:hypothetical protein
MTEAFAVAANKSKEIGKKVLKLGAVGLGAFALFSPDYINVESIFPGSLGDKVSQDKAITEAKQSYLRAFHKASPAGKFVMQYLTPGQLRVKEYQHNTGIISGLWHKDDSDYMVTINNACLDKTAYDVAGGSIKGSYSGIFSSGVISGDVPTAAAYAYQDSNNPDVLLVRSGHTDSKDLHFTGLLNGDQLVPADQQTQNVLSTYGCEVGVQEVRQAAIGEQTSDYLYGQ